MSPHIETTDYDKSEGRAIRLLELYFCIEENPGIKADELVEKFGISPASLYRDIQSLKKMGIAIDYTSSNRGGYRIEKGSIRFVRVKSAEVKPLLIARELFRKLSFPDGDIFDLLLANILGTVRENEVERIQIQLNEHLYFRSPLNRRFDLSAKEQVDTLSRLLEASFNRWSVQFQYPARDSSVSVRLVNPLGLWFGQTAWYLAAWCHERKALRTFAVDKIRYLELLESRTFPVIPGFSLAEWVETSWIATPSNTPSDTCEVIVEFDPHTGREIAGFFWHPSQNFQLPNNSLNPVLATFRLSKESIETEFRSWVQSFGSKARIVGIK